ncbi:ABC transporter permease [Mesorhizobium sp. M1338]|uniref:ABC transporter permease n=1 Tax=unclassified Mesorhizobium TaxID=325217 RepID=UPI00333AAB06
MKPNVIAVFSWRITILIAILAIWQWGYDLRSIGILRYIVPSILDPYFVSRPSEIWQSFLRLGCFADQAGTMLDRSGIGQCFNDNANNLWSATLATLKNTFFGFLGGTISGVVVGMVLGRSDYLSKVFEPYVVALNSIPRIALVPLIILMFGIGDMSKIVTAWIVVFFVVFFNTYEGTRAVDQDQIAAARLLGASEGKILRTVVVPSALAWVFASLTPAVSFALVGVIVGEFIGSERGVGKLIVESEARADAAGMMVAIFVLMIVGILLAVIVRRIQAYCLRWQPQFNSHG